MRDLDKHIGKTIYLAGYSVRASDCTDAKFECFIHKKDVEKYLTKESVANLGDLTLLHGTVTKAISIPNILHDNMDIFLLIPQATLELDSYIIQCSDLEHLQKVVTCIVTQQVDTDEDLNDLVDDLLNLDIQSIEDLYILYGYEIELKYSFSVDDIDEELVEESKKLYTKIESGQKK